ncbi:MAG: sulfatase [Pirellulaceae bacterium]|nr:sulfatase [Pirellulaceae bacterium]
MLLLCDHATQAAEPPVGASRQFLPNILWITSEDNGPHLGCYGDLYADTPHLDALAARSMKYDHAWSCAPVCAPARTTIITGMYPTSLGAQHMRSEVALPTDFKLLPQRLRELGYYCTNNSKTDYNLTVDSKEIWNQSSAQAHWRGRPAGRPFFAVFNFTISHESQLRTRPHNAIHDPQRVPLPSFHPDTPEVRQDWAQYYDRVTEMDREVGSILLQLDNDGLTDNTIVFYFSDHGSGMPRCKRWLYECGLRVPLIVHIPERLRALVPGEYQPGGTSQRLVSFVDLVPTLLSIAGQKPPAEFPGGAFLGKYSGAAPQYLYGFRDRMDERYDMSRAVRDANFSYIRNFQPHRPQGAYLEYMFQTPTTRVWQQYFDEGRLNEAQRQFWLTKPAEELYDLRNDPDQIHNLIAQPEHAETAKRLRDELMAWMIRSGDLGLLPEGEVLAKSGGKSPRELGLDHQRFPIEEILRVADQATRPEPGDMARLLQHRLSPHSACRYWLAHGLLLRTILAQDRAEALQAASSMAHDESPHVRSIANETLARFGTADDRRLAIVSLLRMADARNTNAMAAVEALGSLDWCRPTKDEVGHGLKGLPTSVWGLPKRYESYITRLVQRIDAASQFERSPK